MTKLFLFLSLIILGYTLSAQVDFDSLHGRWTQAVINDSGEVVIRISRGGLDEIIFSENGELEFIGAHHCTGGIGKSGNWSINERDSTLTLHYTAMTDRYLGTIDLDETEVYKIEKLSSDNLILLKTDSSNQQPLAWIYSH